MTEPRPDRVRVAGPLASFADGFCARLAEQGYSLRSAEQLVQLLAQLSRWMQAEGLDVGALSEPAVERFLSERRRAGSVSRLSPAALRPLLSHLDALGVLPAVEAAEATAVDRLVDAFCRYLREERGLVAGSVELYARVARRFLGERPEPLADALAGLSGRGVNAVLLRGAAPGGAPGG